MEQKESLISLKRALQQWMYGLLCQDTLPIVLFMKTRLAMKTKGCCNIDATLHDSAAQGIVRKWMARSFPKTIPVV
jgi:hypothetical protein